MASRSPYTVSGVEIFHNTMPNLCTLLNFDALVYFITSGAIQHVILSEFYIEPVAVVLPMLFHNLVFFIGLKENTIIYLQASTEDADRGQKFGGLREAGS